MDFQLINWGSVTELFEALNHAGLTYTVMRNHENMDSPDFFCGGHEDIDILVDDVELFVRISGARCKMWPEDDIHFVLFIDRLGVPVDVRHVGDSYYDNKWENDILDRRVIASNGNWYVMSEEDYYHSLAYHAILQKKTISTDYLPRLKQMAENLNLKGNSIEDHLANIDDYIRKNGYSYSRPDDSSVPVMFDKPAGIQIPEDTAGTGRGPVTGRIKESKKADIARQIRYDHWRRQLASKGSFSDIERTSRKIYRKFGIDISGSLSRIRLSCYTDRYKDEIDQEYAALKAAMARKINENVHEPVFTMWLNGIDQAPQAVKACISSFSHINRELIVISGSNIGDYINLPAHIRDKYEKGLISHSHYSSIVCTYLLAMYGGVWIDPAVYIAEALPEYMTDDLFMFKQAPLLHEYYSYADWWISCHAGENLMLKMLALLNVYWKHENACPDNAFHVFMTKVIEENREIAKRLDRIPVRMAESTLSLMNSYNKEYSESEWAEMKRISPVFKCTYKVTAYDTVNTYYSRLCNGSLE